MKEFWQAHQRIIVLVCLSIALSSVLVFGFLKLFNDEQPTPSQLEESWSISSTLAEGTDETTQALILSFADIKGGVKEPGVYQIDTNTRLADLVQLAGGFSAQAETKELNLALKIEDQMLVYVPLKGEKTQQEIIVLPENSQAENRKINLNTANSQELQQLNGIGPKKAEAIINYREEHGSFQTLDELMEVSGIGEKTYANLVEEIIIK